MPGDDIAVDSLQEYSSLLITVKYSGQLHGGTRWRLQSHMAAMYVASQTAGQDIRH